jgi:rhomboid protease GluP
MLHGMFDRQKGRPEVCAWCGSLVGVNATQCYTCGRRNPGLWGFGRQLRMLGSDLGFVSGIVYGCSALYVLGLLLTLMLGGDVMGGGGPMGLLSADWAIQRALGASGASALFEYHMWWTVLSAGWLHGGILHIVFNMMALRSLGVQAAALYGPSRMMIIYTVGSIAGFALSSTAFLLHIPFFGGYRTLGASAPILGLLGAALYYGRRTGNTPLRQMVSGNLIGLMVMGFIVPGIDNAAHAGGFAGGYLAGMWLDPQKPERIAHTLWAFACLALTALAVLVSAFHLGLIQLLWAMATGRAG